MVKRRRKRKGKIIEFDLVEFKKKLAPKFKELGKKMQDMRPLFEQLSSDFYKDEKKIFSLKGPGKYEDLSESYKNSKMAKYGFLYPILFANGKLARSLLHRRGPGSINIIDKQFFEIGTSVSYARFHHSKLARRKLPRRPIFFFAEQNKDMAFRWNRIIGKYYEKVVGGVF